MANNNIRMKIEFPGFKNFNKVLKEYSAWSKKQPAEIVNSKLFYIARNATNTTKKADPGKIRNELESNAKNYDAPLAAILVNRDLGRQNKKGLYGEKMVKAVEKRIKSAVSHINFLRSGWLPAIRKLDIAVKQGDISFSRRYAPKQATGIKQIGKPKGDAIWAKNTSFRCWGEIQNWIGQGKQASSTVTQILTEGLKQAVIQEMNSMIVYIQRKYDAQHNKLFKRNF